MAEMAVTVMAAWLRKEETLENARLQGAKQLPCQAAAGYGSTGLKAPDDESLRVMQQA
jgi:hypothetical protein